MSRGAIELFVQRAVLMQNAVENVGSDPPRRQTRHLGWQGESLRRHGALISRKNRIARSVSAYASGRKSLLPPEYAKYKNRPTEFAAAAPSLWGKPESSASPLRLEIE